MRRLTALIAFATLLVAPAAASAKEITKVRACGTDGCITTTDAAILRGLTNGGPPTVPPPMRGGVISLRSSVSDGSKTVAHFTSWWAPSLRLLVAEDGTWMALPAPSLAAMQRVTAGLKPQPASTIGLSTPTPAAAPPSSDGGFDWLLVLVPGAALALAAALLVLLRRRPHGDLPVKQGV
jgi:hypothetical protein